ncbi:MAG TPA: TlpA disulfide reductase family protein [Terracidiphilus sp.]|jgi:thiol-disulfide isomerase/thioredoxin
MKDVFLWASAIVVACLIFPAQAKRAPDLQLKDLAGKTQKIADLRGAIAVVNFWATWCGPCREELPLLSRLSQEYASKKVRFIAVSANEPGDRGKVDEFLKSNKLEMDVWVGATDYMLDRADLGNVLPATMILDDRGEVVARILGEAREAEIRAALDWLLGDRSGSPPPAVAKHY